MIQLACNTCGEQAQVQSLLAAAQEPCARCGQPLMGPIAGGVRAPKPAGFDEPPPTPWEPAVPRGSARLVFGALFGSAACIGVVIAIGVVGADMPLRMRGAILGAMMGVLLAPVLAVSSFLSMFILPFSIEGVLGDSAWTRIATGLREGRVAPLILPFLFFVGLPMTLCAFGGTKFTVINDAAIITASLGAALFGAIVGSMVGALLGSARQTQ